MNKAELLRQIFEADPRPAFGFRADYRVIWVNRSCADHFPGLVEEMALGDFFPDCPWEALKQMNGSSCQRQAVNPQDGSVLSFTLYPEEEGGVFVGVWQPSAAFAVSAGDRKSAGGVQLLTSRLRLTMNLVFNNLRVMSEKLERGRAVSAEDNVERVGRLCQQLLRTGYLLQQYYASEDGSGFFPEPTAMAPFLNHLFDQADFYLEPVKIHLNRSVSCQGACCMIDRRQIQLILLTLIDLSAQQMAKGGVMEINAVCMGQDFCLTFSDRATPFSFFTSREDTPALLSEDEDFIQIAIELIDRIVRRNRGRCMVAENNGGIRLTIRLPLDHAAGMEVRDETIYRAGSSLSSWGNDVAVLLSNLEP